jgi:ABC-2 type transport system ATP-binding protein
VSAPSLTTSPGEIVYLVGPNGAGKTTLLRYIAGIFPCDSGTLSVNGKETDPTASDWPNIVSFVPDDGGTVPLLTVTEQLILRGLLAGLSQKEAEKRAASLRDLLDLQKSADTLACDLSAGLRKRLGIALGILLSSDYYMFDEPFSSVDTNGAAVFVRILETLSRKKRTILLASHSPDIVKEIATRIWVFGDSAVKEISERDEAAYLSTGHTAGIENEEPELPWINL